ncbi:hypothetical protein WJX81_000217 [Elliptochloris bilobata]|uniref:VASt domain-containing protein n=1 Tax=Elliptochloris bilobata TaxID=381761 RepID=A0AAW1RV25_9CHLO
MVQDRAVESSEQWQEGKLLFERLQILPNYEKCVPRIGRPYVKPKDIAFTDLYEFDPEQTRKPPFRVRVRTTLPFLGSRFESVRMITISDEIPGVSCRHTLKGHVRVGIIGVGHHVERSILQNTIATLHALRTAVHRYRELQHAQTVGDAGKAGSERLRGPAPHLAAGPRSEACQAAPLPCKSLGTSANGWRSPQPAEAEAGKLLGLVLGNASPPWPASLAACGRGAQLRRAESAVSTESVYFDAESIEGMQSPRSACSLQDNQAWPACGDAAELVFSLGEVRLEDMWCVFKGHGQVVKLRVSPDYDRWVPPELTGAIVARGDFGLHHTYECVPAEVRQAPYRTHSMSLLPIFGDKAWSVQHTTIEDAGPERCRLTLTGEVRVAVPGLGPLAERVIVGSVAAALQLLPCLVGRCLSVQREVSSLSAALAEAQKASKVFALLKEPFPCCRATSSDAAVRLQGDPADPYQVDGAGERTAPNQDDQLAGSVAEAFTDQVEGLSGAEWGAALQRACERLSAGERTTVAAVARDMADALAVIRADVAPGAAHALEHTQGTQPSLGSAVDVEKAQQWSVEAAKWCSLWREQGIARSPQAILSLRLVHLLAFFVGAGWVCQTRPIVEARSSAGTASAEDHRQRNNSQGDTRTSSWPWRSLQACCSCLPIR